MSDKELIEEAQVEAAAEAHRKHGKGTEYAGIVCRECDEYFEDRAGFETHRMRAALTAASVAPQAESVPRGTDFFVAARVERLTHAKRGWPVEHDRKQGVDHLLRLALDYLANGKSVKAGSLIMAARELSQINTEIRHNPLEWEDYDDD